MRKRRSAMVAVLVVGAIVGTVRPVPATIPAGGVFIGVAFYDVRDGCEGFLSGRITGRMQAGSKTWNVSNAPLSANFSCLSPGWAYATMSVPTPSGKRYVECAGSRAAAQGSDPRPRLHIFIVDCVTSRGKRHFTMTLQLLETQKEIPKPDSAGAFTFRQTLGTYETAPARLAL